MIISEKQDDVSIWGIKWHHFIEQLPNDIVAEIGCLIDVYLNAEYGMFALLYIDLEEINIENDVILNKIKYKQDKPYIIYKDPKYKDICAKWNSGLNTVYSIKDFKIVMES